VVASHTGIEHIVSIRSLAGIFFRPAFLGTVLLPFSLVIGLRGWWLKYRNSVITSEKDKLVFPLKDNEGTTWIYKNYTTATDPAQTYEDLPNLDTRLKNLPSVLKFYTRPPDRDPVLKAVGGKARIIWDDRGGSWDALDPGVANYQLQTGFSLIFSMTRNWTLLAMM
jgi:hypothetical protein